MMNYQQQNTAIGPAPFPSTTNSNSASTLMQSKLQYTQAIQQLQSHVGFQNNIYQFHKAAEQIQKLSMQHQQNQNYLKANNLFLYTGPNSLNYPTPSTSNASSQLTPPSFNPLGNIYGNGLGGLGTTNILGSQNLITNPYGPFFNQSVFPNMMSVMPPFGNLNTTTNTNSNALLIDKINNKTNNSSSNPVTAPKK
jgi:hypothetical protein